MPASARYFNRYWSITVGNRLIESRGKGIQSEPTLRCRFSVEKNIENKQGPPRISMDIYNLEKNHRSELQSLSSIPVEIVAGYQEFHGRIFLGKLTTATTVRDGPNWITNIIAGDGAEIVSSTVKKNTTLKGPIGVDKIVDSILECVQGETRQLSKKFKEILRNTKNAKEASRGVALTGRCMDELRKYTEPYGVELIVNDGELMGLSGPSDTLPGPIVFISPKTGLIGSVEMGEKRSVRFTALMNSNISPGRKVLVESGSFSGNVKVKQVTHTGDTDGSDWYSVCDGISI